jgi:hypothetical protein
LPRNAARSGSSTRSAASTARPRWLAAGCIRAADVLLDALGDAERGGQFDVDAATDAGAAAAEQGGFPNTSTNGMMIDSDEKREAALLVDRMQISLDGIDQAMAARYQRGIDFAHAYRNMKSLVDYRDTRGLARPQIIWKYLLFWWNDHRQHLQTALELGRQAGVDEMLFEKTVSPYYGISWRYYLGLLDNLGEKVAEGFRVRLCECEAPCMTATY